MSDELEPYAEEVDADAVIPGVPPWHWEEYYDPMTAARTFKLVIRDTFIREAHREDLQKLQAHLDEIKHILGRYQRGGL